VREKDALITNILQQPFGRDFAAAPAFLGLAINRPGLEIDRPASMHSAMVSTLATTSSWMKSKGPAL
jgi:hypothetical protein